MPTELPRHRPRFSLLTLLLLMTIAAMGIVIWPLWGEVEPLRTEVRRLRNEVGALSVEDETKFHAIAVPTSDEFTWKWRVWIPPGRHYRVFYQGDAIPKAGYPASLGSISLGTSGEQWVEYRIRQDLRAGQWMGALATRDSGVGSCQQDWVEWSRKASEGEGVGRTTTVFEPNERVLLQRFRVSQTNSSSQVEDPAAGFMIWVEPAP